MSVREYQVIGRSKPTDAVPQPTIYRMRLFAPNATIARSRFWYYMKKLNRVKKAAGEIIATNEIFEKNPATVKNFGISLRYQSRTANHNIWKEFRDTTRVGAVNQLLQEMNGRHRTTYNRIQIMEVKEIKAADLKRANTKQFIDPKIAFPLPHRQLAAPSRAFRTKFKAQRASTHFG
eukprot:TRINITY_DN8850_c0_g1_i1.p2 TRINITY_DN8850_c0_g1~~TRINITY_DN8850_c0_g1_i1.p2  ORF type:complete len:177 (-),score=50.17 TRINITY_DN8850_c0_g1_i1:99-629(-)